MKRTWKHAVFFVFLGLFLQMRESGAEDSQTIVKKFEFTGIRRTPQDRLREISAKYIHSPLLGDWPDKMVLEIKKIPMVKDVHLIRDLTGNVTIQIVEWSPFANLSLDDFYWIDHDGRIIQPADSKGMEGMVFFSGPWKNRADYEKKNGSELISEGVGLYADLVQAGLPEKEISEIHFDAKTGWIMYRVKSRAPVVFGTQNLSQKAHRFVEVASQLDPFEGAIVNIDTDFHDRIVVKLVPGNEHLPSPSK